MSNKKTEYTVQYLENLSADLGVDPPILRRALVGRASDGKYYNVAVSPDGSFSANPSMTINISTSGSVKTTTIQKTIGSDVFQKTIAEDSSDSSSIISEWIKV